MNTRNVRVATAVAAVITASGLALAADQTPIPLNYNFNGMVHSGEAGWPDNPDGFRSISDRALAADGAPGSFTAGPVVGSTGLSYSIVGTGLALDIVHLGNRLVFAPYDLTEDGDNIGIQPNWDTSPDHTGPQVTDVSGLGLEMFGNTQIGVLYQVSNGGGQFDMTLTFTDASSVTVRLSGPDWFGAQNPAAPLAGVLSQSRLGATVWNATNSNDLGNPAPAGERLNIVEGIVSVQDLINDGFGDITGKTLSSITFGNASYPAGNFNRGYAIIAATVRGASEYGPEGVGSVAPNPVVSGQSATFSVTVTPGSGAPNAVTSVAVDGTTLDLGSIALNDSGAGGDLVAGDNIWTSTVSVPGTALAGPRNAAFTVTDAQARQFNGLLSFSVVGPPNATDIGTLSSGVTNLQAELVAGAVVWYRFELAQSVDAVDFEFLDIDTEGSVITGNDTEIGLYSATGALVSSDDDDGSDFLSQLTYGSAIPRAAVGNGLAYNSRDGASLAAGTYYLAVTGYNSVFNATNWNVSSPHTRTGTLNINLRFDVSDPNDAVLAGPINNPANGSDYYLLVRGLNFNLAESIGQLLGGHLASIGDADENEFVRANVLRFDGTDRRGWIGFTDAASEGNFVWTDGSAVTFTNWGSGEPNNANGTEHYAEMLGSNGLWNDLGVNGVSGGGDWAIVEVPGGGPQFCDADWCQDGEVGVPDIFCFLSAWFAMEPDARCYGGTCDVPAIFAFLTEWFSTPQGPCTP